VRFVLRAALAGILTITMTGMSVAWAAAVPPSAPLGMVLQANRADGEIDVASQGATIYDGETLTTDTARTLRVQLGGPQMYMRSNSSAQVHKLANGFSADLASGSVVISTNQGQTFQVLADGATIRPVADAPAIAQITILTPKELVLTSTKGSLEISMGSEVKTIDPGNSYRMEVEPDPVPAPDPQAPPQPGGSNRFALVLITAVAIGTAIGVWRVLVSPNNPAPPTNLTVNTN
jgi:hypothetical protein